MIHYCKKTFLIAFISLCFLSSNQSIAQSVNDPVSVVKDFGDNMHLWCETQDIDYQSHIIEDVFKQSADEKDRVRIEDKIMTWLIENVESDVKLSSDDDKMITTYFNKFEVLMDDNSINYTVSDYKIDPNFSVPDIAFASTKQEPLTFVSAVVNISTPMNIKETDMFFVRGGRITKIFGISERGTIGDALFLYSQKKYKEAFQLLRRLAYADYDNIEAQYYLSVMEIERRGCKDMSKKLLDQEASWFIWKCYNAGKKNDASAIIDRYSVWTHDMTYRGLKGQPMFLSVQRPCSQGRIITQDAKTELYGYADETGKSIIPNQYSFAFAYGTNGLACVRNEQGLCGYIDINGNIKIPFKYVGAMSEWVNDKTFVETKQGVTIIDINGQELRKFDGLTLASFVNCTDCVALRDKKNSTLCIYDYDGELLEEIPQGNILVNYRTGVVSFGEGAKTKSRLIW